MARKTFNKAQKPGIHWIPGFIFKQRDHTNDGLS